MQCIGVLRRVLGVPQQLLAERSGTSRRSLNEYERGSAVPTRARMVQIDRALVEIVEERLYVAIEEIRDRIEARGQMPPIDPEPEPDPGDGGDVEEDGAAEPG